MPSAPLRARSMPQQGTRHPWVDDPESIVERRQQRRQHERSVAEAGGTGGPGGGPQPQLQPRLTWSAVGTPCHKGCHTLAFGRWEGIRGRELAGTTPRTKSPDVLCEATRIDNPGAVQKRRGLVVLVSFRCDDDSRLVQGEGAEGPRRGEAASHRNRSSFGEDQAGVGLVR